MHLRDAALSVIERPISPTPPPLIDTRRLAPPQPRASRRVTLRLNTTTAFARGVLAGFARFNREHDNWAWHLEPSLQTGADTEMSIALDWVAGSIIVRCAEATARIIVDDGQIVRLAIQHLRDRGFEHFAFCGVTRGLDATLDARADAFQKQIARVGRSCHAYTSQVSDLNWDEQQEQLAEWIAALPRPVAVMAVNDARGLDVLDAARRAGLTVPDELAVIGVENDTTLCDLSNPPLTSIDVNAEGIGYEAAATLDRLLSHHRAPARVVKLAPCGVVMRRSTDVIASEDEEVGLAVRYIREHACGKLQVGDVLVHSGMSRASLQYRMKKLLGRTIHQEIQRARLAKAKELLVGKNLTIKQVAHESGFASVQYMTRVFRHTTGETPARFRQRRGG